MLWICQLDDGKRQDDAEAPATFSYTNSYAAEVHMPHKTQNTNENHFALLDPPLL